MQITEKYNKLHRELEHEAGALREDVKRLYQDCRRLNEKPSENNRSLYEGWRKCAMMLLQSHSNCAIRQTQIEGDLRECDRIDHLIKKATRYLSKVAAIFEHQVHQDLRDDAAKIARKIKEFYYFTKRIDEKLIEEFRTNYEDFSETTSYLKNEHSNCAIRQTQTEGYLKECDRIDHSIKKATRYLSKVAAIFENQTVEENIAVPPGNSESSSLEKRSTLDAPPWENEGNSVVGKAPETVKLGAESTKDEPSTYSESKPCALAGITEESESQFEKSPVENKKLHREAMDLAVHIEVFYNYLARLRQSGEKPSELHQSDYKKFRESAKQIKLVHSNCVFRQSMVESDRKECERIDRWIRKMTLDLLYIEGILENRSPFMCVFMTNQYEL